MDPTITPTVVGNTETSAQSPRRTVVQAAEKAARLVIEAQNLDVRSSQFQCVVRIENGGTALLRVLSLRTLTPLGTEVQQVIDTAQSESRSIRDDLYGDM